MRARLGSIFTKAVKTTTTRIGASPAAQHVAPWKIQQPAHLQVRSKHTIVKEDEPSSINLEWSEKFHALADKALADDPTGRETYLSAQRAREKAEKEEAAEQAKKINKLQAQVKRLQKSKSSRKVSAGTPEAPTAEQQKAIAEHFEALQNPDGDASKEAQKAQTAKVATTTGASGWEWVKGAEVDGERRVENAMKNPDLEGILTPLSGLIYNQGLDVNHLPTDLDWLKHSLDNGLSVFLSAQRAQERAEEADKPLAQTATNVTSNISSKITDKAAEQAARDAAIAAEEVSLSQKKVAAGPDWQIQAPSGNKVVIGRTSSQIDADPEVVEITGSRATKAALVIPQTSSRITDEAAEQAARDEAIAEEDRSPPQMKLAAAAKAAQKAKSGGKVVIGRTSSQIDADPVVTPSRKKSTARVIPNTSSKITDETAEQATREAGVTTPKVSTTDYISYLAKNPGIPGLGYNTDWAKFAANRAETLEQRSKALTVWRKPDDSMVAYDPAKTSQVKALEARRESQHHVDQQLSSWGVV